MLIEIPSTTYHGVTLAGGWHTRVPDISVRGDDIRVKDIVSVLVRQGMLRPEAEARAVESVKVFFEREWRARIMKTVGRWAKVYAGSNRGSLKGFDPALVARYWVPGVFGGSFGEGNPDVRALFVEMRRSVNK
jgi:hypothetical protein